MVAAACFPVPALAGAGPLSPSPLPGTQASQSPQPRPLLQVSLSAVPRALANVLPPLPTGSPPLTNGLPPLPTGSPLLTNGLPPLPKTPPLPGVPPLVKVPPVVKVPPLVKVLPLVDRVVPVPSAAAGHPPPRGAPASRSAATASGRGPSASIAAPSPSNGLSSAARPGAKGPGGLPRGSSPRGRRASAHPTTLGHRFSPRRPPSASASRLALAGRARVPARRSARSSPVAGRRPKSNDPLSAIGRLLPLPLPVPDWSKPVILLLLILAAGLAIRSRLATRRAHRVEAQQRLLVEDLDSLQAALVPAIPARLGGLSVSVAYRPADGPAAGGDFYDAFPVGDGGVAVLLGDASGHGRDALARSALMRYTLRAYVEAGLAPQAALELAGRVLAGETGEEFTTVAVALYDAGAGTLTYAVAGHPPPLVVGDADHEPVLVCSSPPVGWDRPTGRRQTIITLPAGARACFFSDGLTESRTAGTMLGREGLTRILRQLGPNASAATLIEQLRDVADDVSDDMAACIIRADGPHSAPPLRVEELELDACQLSGTQAERFLTACEVPAEEIPAAVARARRVADERGTAVLRVRMAPSPAQVAIAAREGQGPGGTPLKGQLSAGTPPAAVPA